MLQTHLARAQSRPALQTSCPWAPALICLLTATPVTSSGTASRRFPETHVSRAGDTQGCRNGAGVDAARSPPQARVPPPSPAPRGRQSGGDGHRGTVERCVESRPAGSSPAGLRPLALAPSSCKDPEVQCVRLGGRRGCDGAPWAGTWLCDAHSSGVESAARAFPLRAWFSLSTPGPSAAHGAQPLCVPRGGLHACCPPPSRPSSLATSSERPAWPPPCPRRSLPSPRVRLTPFLLHVRLPLDEEPRAGHRRLAEWHRWALGRHRASGVNERVSE